MPSIERSGDERVRSTKVLIVDNEPYMRKVIRGLLVAIGVRNISDASDGMEGLEAVKSVAPDIVLLDWEMPFVDGADFMRIVRSPDTFPYADVPVLMLTGHRPKSRVLEAVRRGIHEYLLKPVSSRALCARILSIIDNPRPTVRKGSSYGPEPRNPHTKRPQFDSAHASVPLD